MATCEELLLCHAEEYVRLVEKEAKVCFGTSHDDGSRFLSTGDVSISSSGFDIARLAAGGVLTAVDAVFEQKAPNAFCVVRPPGHHACSNRGMGFCLFNSVAIGARYAMRRYQIKKVLIVDWDVHHGNGTQEIFNCDPDVFYFSTHQEGIYPGTGLADDWGEKEAAHTKLNCPIAPGEGSREAVLLAFQEKLLPAMKLFQPECVFVSCGFDAHRLDPLGGMNLTEDDFYHLTRLVQEIAHTYAHGRLISVLEGGYDLRALALSSVAHVQALNTPFIQT
jgi:acetoin utilization deacetylase AcuC-like enzyme